jgi:hypothetical protein
MRTLDNEEALAHQGCCAMIKKIYMYHGDKQGLEESMNSHEGWICKYGFCIEGW